MNNTTRYIIGGSVGFITGFLLVFLLVKPAPPEITSGQVIEGLPDTTLKRGAEVVVTEQKYSGKKTSYPLPILPVKDEAYFSEQFDEDSFSLQVDVVTYPAADSISLKYFAEIKPVSYVRVDTVFITRIDTLVKTVMQPGNKEAFYNTFEFGFGAAAVLIAGIVLIFK